MIRDSDGEVDGSVCIVEQDDLPLLVLAGVKIGDEICWPDGELAGVEEFVAIENAVAAGIPVEGIGAVEVFLVVGEAVTIGVDVFHLDTPEEFVGFEAFGIVQGDGGGCRETVAIVRRICRKPASGSEIW